MKQSRFLCAVFFLMLSAGNVFAGTADDQVGSLPSSRKEVGERQEHTRSRLRSAEAESLAKKYSLFKERLEQETGLSYTIDVSFLGQRGAPNGKGTPWQSQYYGTVNWDMFQSDTYGSGSMQLAYTAVRYWGMNANTLADRISVINPVNDYPKNANYFDQLSFTYQLPGALNWLSVTAGQFPIYNFDGTAYDSNQQINFINDALSQNGSDVYPSASLGAFVTMTPNDLWSVSFGFQDAHNISGSRITTDQFDQKRFTSFGSISFTPTIDGWGTGEYSLLLYNQPSVPEQPQNSNGWSLNLSQNIGQFGVFARINGASHSPNSIQQSYVIGGVYNNPFHRNSLDQIGLAATFNKLNKKVNGEGTRAYENVVEAYWSFGISEFMILTPDIQFYLNPGADTEQSTATVTSLRATFMF